MSPIPLGILALAGAAGGAPAYELIESQVLSSNASSVTFSSLDTVAADYKHLQIRMVMQSSISGTNNYDLRFRLNGGTFNYARHALAGNGSGVNAYASSSQSYGYAFAPVTQNSTPQIYGAAILDFLDFSSTTKNTTVRTLAGGVNSGEKVVSLSSSLWADTSALTSIQLYPASGNFTSGSRLSLYAIKGE